MNAEIISVGTELLLGHIVNTNAAYLGGRLAALGIDLYNQTTVGDNPERLAEAVRLALGRADIVMLTGGLGPTVDDITAAAVARAAGRPMVLSKAALADLRNYFKRRDIGMPACNIRQARIPEGARIARNTVGTAPGLIIELGRRLIVCLPGPPRELRPMFEKDIEPLLKRRFRTGSVLKTRTIKTTGLPEARVNAMFRDLLGMAPPTTVGIYAKLREVHLVIMAKAPDSKAADRAIARVEKKIRSKLRANIFGYDDDTLEGAAGGRLIEKNLTIAVAESCTGGLISSRLTDVSGSSKYFIRGAVPYANEVKVKYVGVRADTLRRFGAVSPQVAAEMARGIRSIMHVDVGLAVTGIAGPSGGTARKPVGLVYIALVTDAGRTVKKFRFTGSRADIKWQASQAALDMVRRLA
jgi:nicotinamide-nucleotide amidase